MFRNRTPSLLPPQFRSIHVGKVWQIYVRRSYYHLNKASHKFAENRAKYSNIRKAKGGETGRRVEIGRARNSSPPCSVLAQGISIANEITGTYRSGIRPDGLLGFGLVTSRPPFPLPLLIGRRPNTETRIARQRVCGRIVSPPKFRSTSGPKTRLNEPPIRFQFLLLNFEKYYSSIACGNSLFHETQNSFFTTRSNN